MSEAIERRLHELRTTAAKYAKAEADRTYLEEFKHSKLALLMKDAEAKGAPSVAAQERDARCNEEYLNLLEGLRFATETAERLRWELRIAERGADLWRTAEATKRAERRGYGA